MKTRARFVSIVVGSLLIAAPVAAQHVDKATQLHRDMRKLWTDHTVWTRDYIVAAVDDRPDTPAAATRLMKNQEDIGIAVAAYYGQAAGQQLTSLLKQHIAIAVDLITAAKAGDQAAQKQANDKWQRNAVDIATFLSKANPNWPNGVLVNMMKMHLATTRRSRRATEARLGGGRPRLRCGLQPHPDDGRRVERRHRQAVPREVQSVVTPLSIS